MKSVFTGKEIDVPKDISEVLMFDERVLHSIRQARLMQAITPDSIFVTTQRIIIRKPKTFGLRRETIDYKFVDMANTKIKKGIINSTIIVKMRFLSEDCILKGIPNRSAMEIFKTIQKLISASGQVTPTGAVNVNVGGGTDDPLKLLKLRYARGEISKEEYFEMKKILG